jgi:hypothetical protein
MRFDVIEQCNEYNTGSQSLEVCDDDAADYSREIESIVPDSSTVMGNEGHRDSKIIREYDSEYVETTIHTTPNTAVFCFRTGNTDTYHTISAINDTPDDRV